MTQKKLLPMSLLGLFVFVVMSSITLSALETKHDCPGHDCPKCYSIHVCDDALKNLSFAVMVMTACALSLCAAVLCMRPCGDVFFRSDLVALSVKLSR